MKYWLKLLVSIALAISIPLQGLAAVTMSICEDSPLPVVSMNVDASINTVMDMPADCHHESASNCSDKSSQDCSNMKCSFCHVSVFQLPDTNHVVQMDSYSTTYPDLTIPLYQFFSPPLLHPPKQSLS
jgi:hypothetical protein